MAFPNFASYHYLIPVRILYDYWTQASWRNSVNCIPHPRAYGWGGRLGLGTPQGNPTVEAEMRRLIPDNIEYFTLRLFSDSNDPATRLHDYLLRLPEFMSQFATLKLDGFMFACTASSYLLSRQQSEQCRLAAQNVLGAPVLLAADAIGSWLENHGANRIAVVTPYPDWLNEPAKIYWQEQGYEIIQTIRVDIDSQDTYKIYDQQSPTAVDILNQLNEIGVDAYLISGTGMPSLPVIAELELLGKTVVSSNLALAAAGLELLGQSVVSRKDWKLPT